MGRKYILLFWKKLHPFGEISECDFFALKYLIIEQFCLLSNLVWNYWGRKVIYTTNIIESVHRQFRSLTKNKGGFPKDNSLLKLLFMGIQNASKKWTIPVRNWSLTISQLAIHFEGRLDKALNL